MTSTLRARCRIAGVLIAVFGLAAATWTQSGKPPIREESDAIVIESHYARLVVGNDGMTRGFQDARTGTEYLDLRFPVYFMSARRGNVEFGSSRIARSGDYLDIQFGGSGIHARIRVGVKQGYFVFEVVSVNQNNLDELILVDLPLTISERVARVQEYKEHSETINICRNDRFGVCVASVNLIAHSRTTRYQPAAFRSSCYPRFGMAGAKVALLAGPADGMINLIGQMEVEQGLPHPTLGGEWGKISREIQKSYLFVDFTEHNIDRVIDLAKAGGFSYILNYSGAWATSNGKYQVNTRNFPNGLAGLKTVMDKMHAAGLKGGAHMLAGCVDFKNAYVTPVPDPRLTKDDMRILASDLSASDTTIPLTTSPEGLPEIESYSISTGKSLVIDDEIIDYKTLRTEPPFGLEGCTRGAYGTRPAPHRSGSRIYHLSKRWGMFVINADSDLLEEYAQNIADVINTCGFDQVYFDGLDGVERNGPFFYYLGKLVGETTKRFKREVIVQGSNLAHINWHDFSRLYTIDRIVLNPKRWVDYHAGLRLTNAQNNLMPAELGWYGYFLEAPGCESTTPDVIEYVLAKTVGWGVPWSLETNTGILESHGRTREAFALSKTYEELRLRNYFPESVKKVLRTPRQDYKLVQKGESDWSLHPINYGPPGYVALHGKAPAAFTYENRFGEQPLKFRMKARYAPASYGGSGNRVLLDPAHAGEGLTASGSPDFVLNVAESGEQAKSGRTSLKLTANNRSSGRSSWACRTFKLDSPMDLSQNRAVGFWVFGDGSGAKLNVRIDDSERWRSRSHYVVLDFSGWKYCEIVEPSVDPVIEFPYPASGALRLQVNPSFNGSSSLSNFTYKDVGYVTLMLTDAPPNRAVVCYLDRVEALKDFPTMLVNPTLTVNGTAVPLPLTLKDNQYVEFWGDKDATLYDPNGVTLGRFSLKDLPRLRSGVNRVELQNGGGSGGRSQVRVELITMGEALR